MDKAIMLELTAATRKATDAMRRYAELFERLATRERRLRFDSQWLWYWRLHYWIKGRA